MMFSNAARRARLGRRHSDSAARQARLGRRRCSRRIELCMAAALAGLVLWLPRVSMACSVCTAGRDEENKAAFLISTVAMSLLPLIVIGSIVFALWRRIQKFEAKQQASRETASPRLSQAYPNAR